MLGVNALSVNAITAYINNVDVLKSVSLCENGTYTDLRLRGDAAVEDQYAYYFEASNDLRWVIITLDLTKVQRVQNIILIFALMVSMKLLTNH